MIYRSPLSDIDIPDVTLTELVIGATGCHGDRIALVDSVTGDRFTYAELRESVCAAASGLARLGIGPGDVVALMSHNQPAYAIALHAVIAAGAAVTPVNPAYTVDEVAAQVRKAGATVMITSREAADKADAVAGIDHVFVLGESFRRLLTTPAPLPRVDPRMTVALLPFSGGTTGIPKGVRLTHRNLVANLVQHRPGWRIEASDVLAAALPFFHSYGQAIILNSGLTAGATIVTMSRFDVESYLDTLAEHRVTRAYLVPPMVLALASAPPSHHDLSALRYVLCGAAPLDVEIAARAERRLGCLIRQGYGMTEASPGTHQVYDHEFTTVPAGTVGRLCPSTEARVVHPDTFTDVQAGEPGELLIRGPQVMAGYLDGPAATASIVTDGWLRTGDLVRVDAEGLFWIVDRLKELIKYKGYQIAPAELESVLLTHPRVADAAVVGVPHPSGGEAPKAFVVSAGDISADELMSFVAERVAPYKKVRSVEFVTRIPRSPAGKILRRTLR